MENKNINQTTSTLERMITTLPMCGLGTRVGSCYEKSSYHKFEEGDFLILKNRKGLSLPIRPVLKVLGYNLKDIGSGEKGFYDVLMETDEESIPVYNEQGGVVGNRWRLYNEVPMNVGRSQNHHSLPKWNIEQDYKKVPVESFEEAVDLYGSREIETK